MTKLKFKSDIFKSIFHDFLYKYFSFIYIYIYIYMSQNLSGKKNSNLTKKKKKIYNMIMSIRQISENEKQMLPEYRKEIS